MLLVDFNGGLFCTRQRVKRTRGSKEPVDQGLLHTVVDQIAEANLAMSIVNLACGSFQLMRSSISKDFLDFT